MLNKDDLASLVELRRHLHKHPELAGKEKQTSEIIKEFLAAKQPDKIISKIGGFGLLAIFDSKKPGPTICFRCDLDALPIHEQNDFEYRSTNQGIAHKCGHDGHMTMVTGLSILFNQRRPEKGKVALLYQPAEETGEGAQKVLADKKFKKIMPDYIIGIHNLPKKPSEAIVLRKGIFASASIGIEIKLIGATAHAAEPDNGRSPALAMAAIIKAIENLPEKENYESFVLTTTVHAKLGEIAFGTTPGYAEVRATLRAFQDDDIEKLKNDAEQLVEKYCRQFNLKWQIAYTEEFIATESDDQLVNLLKDIVKEQDITLIEPKEPFRWSEDFGHYKNMAPTLFFGLGAGDIPNLHNHDYDFPDEIIATGTNIFYQIALKLLN